MVVSGDWQHLWQKPAKEMGDAMEGLMFLVCIILLNNSDPMEAGPTDCIFIHKELEIEAVLRPPQG